LLAFTPQKLSQQQLEQVENSYRRADFIRTAPNDNAPGKHLPELVAKCVSCDDSSVHAGFYVEEKRGEWIRIQRMDPVTYEIKQGWIHAAGGLEGIPLDKILPELKFIEGCAGYLRQRVADAESRSLSGELPDRVVAELKDFVQSNDVQPTDMASAVALQLAGIVEYLTGRDRVDSLIRAAQHFEEARRMIPYDPNAISPAVGAQVSQEWKQKGRCEQTTLKAVRLSASERAWQVRGGVEILRGMSSTADGSAICTWPRLKNIFSYPIRRVPLEVPRGLGIKFIPLVRSRVSFRLDGLPRLRDHTELGEALNQLRDLRVLDVPGFQLGLEYYCDLQ